MKWKKWFILLWVVIAVVSIGYSISVRSSIPAVELSEKNMDDLPVFAESVGEMEAKSRVYLSKKKIAMTDIYNAADLVVKVRATAERKAEYQSLLTKVNVLEVYKGDHALLNQDIYIYEYAGIFMVDGAFTISLTENCNLMQAGHDYYLLLNFLKRPSGYRYDAVSSRTYLLNNVSYGKFSDRKYSSDHSAPEYEQGMPYGKIKDLDVLYVEQSQIDHYYDMRKDFFDLIH